MGRNSGLKTLFRQLTSFVRHATGFIIGFITGLAARLTDRVPSRILFFVGLTSLVISFYLYISTATKIDSSIATFLLEEPSLEDVLELQDSESSDGVLETDGSSDAETTELLVEVPESLRSDSVPLDPVVISMFDQLELSETLLPNAALLNQPNAFRLSREAILSDSESRIAQDFEVPDLLRERVGFWFDVYTRYDSNQRVIHHALFPWIIFKIVDVSAIINSDSPKHLWMRRMKADRIVKGEVLKIRATLHRLTNRRRLENLTEPEHEMANILAPLGENVRKQALTALRAVRTQLGQRDFFIEGLQLSSRYLYTMERIFAAHRLPVELTRIPFVESSFNRFATSKVGASGVWQIMDGTGRKFMTIDSLVDERRSPLKATEAAAKLLRENHLILHRSWPLAVTAWNHGPSGIRLATKRTNSRDLGKIVGHYRSQSFDFASSNFYCEFLAALHAEKYSAEIFGIGERGSQENLLAVKLTRAIRFRELLNASGMELDDMLALNPDLIKIARQNLTLQRGFRLHIPDWAIEKLDRLVSVQKTRTSLARKD
jgi:membrane-bound lytic murein transglycosylase D